jgi:plastocyanin
VLTLAAVLAMSLGAELSLFSSTAFAAELSTRVELVRPGGRATVRDASPREVVVVWQPRKTGALARSSNYHIATRNKQFDPPHLVVPRGSVVRFPNADPILHNVFSVSPGNAFDVGLYGQGEGESARFDEAGLVRIFCNVHREMFAYILVIDSTHSSSPSADGALRMQGLPEGPGSLIVWHARAEMQTIELASPAQAPKTIQLEIERRQIPAHFNKFGKPYEQRARDRYGS